MRIVLADVHGTVLGKDQTSANLSLLYLASYLKAQRADVEFVYLPQARTISEHLECVQRFRPQFYAISFTSYSAPAAYQLIRRVKAQFPEIVVVCGGAHVTPYPADVLEKSGADVCVISEGEVTFSEIVAAFVFGFMMMFNFWEENGQLEHETAEEVKQSIRDTYTLWRQNLLNYTSRALPSRCRGPSCTTLRAGATLSMPTTTQRIPGTVTSSWTASISASSTGSTQRHVGSRR